jgi:hypothetical protein
MTTRRASPEAKRLARRTDHLSRGEKAVATYYDVGVHTTPKTIESDSGQGIQQAILAVRVIDEAA